MLFALAANGQDRIVFKNAEELDVNITNISTETITYKRWDNLQGPTYTKSKSDIMFVVYQNGKKEVFNEVNNDKTTNVKFQGYGNLGVLILPVGGTVSAGPTLDLSVGAAITDYFYAGFETGLHTLIGGGYFEGYIPLALNMKGYFTKTKARPYLNCSLGGFLGIADLGGFNGFYCQAGAGVDVKRFSIGLGYSGLVKLGTASSLYLKVGVRFGGKKY